MSYSTFLESQNKDLLNSLYEWQEKVRQNFIIIEAKDKRIAESEELLNDTNHQNNFLFIQNAKLESEVAHWKSNHDNQVKLKNQLMDRPDLQDRAESIQKLQDRTNRLEQELNDKNEIISKQTYSIEKLLETLRTNSPPKNEIAKE